MTYKYKVYKLEEDGAIGKVLDITNDFEKWKQKFKNYEVLIVAPSNGIAVN